MRWLLFASVVLFAEQRGFVDVRATLFPQTAPGDSGRVIGDVLLRYEVRQRLTPWL